MGPVDGAIYASNGQSVLAVLRGEESRVLLKDIDDVSPIMRQAIVSVEDQRFYEHNGIDVRGVLRALWEDVRSQEVVEGGSTITQQFVKNAYVRNERTLARKVREAALAWQLEQQWSKDRILVAYLNTVYFGNGAYGIQQAARTYFGKGASKLKLHEAALLAGLPVDPSSYDPVQHPRAAWNRRHYVLSLMVDQGKLTPGQLRAADRKPLPTPDEVSLPGTQGPAPYFVNYVNDQLVAQYGAGRVFGGGLRVTTTIDLKLQDLARTAIEKVLREPGRPAGRARRDRPAHGCGARDVRRHQLPQEPVQPRHPGRTAAGLVVQADRARDGAAPGRLPGHHLHLEADRRSMQATGSGQSPTTRTRISGGCRSSGRWSPPTTRCTRSSRSSSAPPRIVETAHDLGVRTDLPAYFSLGLGQVAVNPLDMARAYATIANDGTRIDGSLLGNRPRVVERVKFEKSGRTRENQVSPARSAGARRGGHVDRVLQDVVRSRHREARGDPGCARRRQDRHDG